MRYISLDSSLPTAVREGFVEGAGFAARGRQSPHLPQEWASRRRRLGDLKGYIRHFKCVLSKLYNIIT